MVTVEDPRLAQIRALCDDAGYAGLPSNLVARIRAVLGAPSVDATPPQGIDRDALLVLLAEFGYDGAPDRAKLADAILALARPAEGYVLTPEERGDVVQALRFEAATIVPDGGDPATADRMRSLAARLREAAQ